MSHEYYARSVQTPSASRKRKETESDFVYDYNRALSYPIATPNWLLAGYMAHEFLNKGTLLGQKLFAGWAERIEPEAKKAKQSYSDVASVLKTDGTHVPGVVNPTQLAKWIHM